MRRIKTLSIFSLSLFFILSVVFLPVAAAGTADFTIRTACLSDGSFKNAASFESGQALYLLISMTDTGDKLGGFKLEVSYNRDALDYNADSSISKISDNAAIFGTNSKDGKVIVAWDTTSRNTSASGDIVVLKFKVKEHLTQSCSLPFTLTVKSLYSSSNGFPNISCTVSQNTATAQFTYAALPQSLLTALLRLETVNADSLPDIVNAETEYNKLTANQKYSLSINHSYEYSLLSTARTRYYRELELAESNKIQAIADGFLQSYGSLLHLTEETVTIEHETLVSDARTAYSFFNTAVTSRLDSGIPKKLSDLFTHIQFLKDVKSQISEFRTENEDILRLTDEMLRQQPYQFYPSVDNLIMLYNTLDPLVQKGLDGEITRLRAMQEICVELIAADETESAIREKVNEFQQKWLYVFTLRTSGVQEKDRAAIELAISDYNALTDPIIKERLSAKIDSLKNLIAVIDMLEPDEKIVYVDGEKVIVKEIDRVTEKEIIEVPTVETVEKEVVKVVEVPGNQGEPIVKTEMNYLDRGFTGLLKILFILLGVSVLTMVFPLIMFIKYRKWKQSDSGFQNNRVA